MTATQSSTLPGYGAEKCIDGIISVDTHKVCHTWGDPAPWLAIDYRISVTVQRVELFNRIGSHGDRTRNVDVRISDELPASGSQMFSGGTLFGHFAGPGTDGQHIVISGQTQTVK